MKDLINLAIYGGAALVVILLLNFGSQIESLSGSVVGISALIAVIVLPLVAGFLLAKREKKN